MRRWVTIIKENELLKLLLRLITTQAMIDLYPIQMPEALNKEVVRILKNQTNCIIRNSIKQFEKQFKDQLGLATH